MEAALCIEAVEESPARYGEPDIFNTDQGSQFTSMDFTAVLKNAEVAILGGWQGRLAADQTRGSIPPRLQDRVEARAGIGRYLAFSPTFNLNRQTPDQALLQRADTNDGGRIIQAEIHLTKRPKTVHTNRACSV
jgi:putative transposase